MIESKIERRCCKWAKDVFDIDCKKLTSSVGDPDRLLLYSGHCCFVEFKKPGEVPRAIQQFRHLELNDKGFKVLVIDDIEEFQIEVIKWVEDVITANLLSNSQLKSSENTNVKYQNDILTK